VELLAQHRVAGDVLLSSWARPPWLQERWASHAWPWSRRACQQRQILTRGRAKGVGVGVGPVPLH
jgi:hypothetical protein